MWCMSRFQLHSIRIPPESGNEAIMLQDDGCRVADCQDLFFPSLRDGQQRPAFLSSFNNEEKSRWDLSEIVDGLSA